MHLFASSSSIATVRGRLSKAWRDRTCRNSTKSTSNTLNILMELFERPDTYFGFFSDGLRKVCLETFLDVTSAGSSSDEESEVDSSLELSESDSESESESELALESELELELESESDDELSDFGAGFGFVG